ncbi:hypothetical protein [Rhodanobacter lindaniclasticus]
MILQLARLDVDRADLREAALAVEEIGAEVVVDRHARQELQVLLADLGVVAVDQQHLLGHVALVAQVGEMVAHVHRRQHRAIKQELAVLVGLQGEVELALHRRRQALLVLDLIAMATGQQHDAAQHDRGGQAESRVDIRLMQLSRQGVSGNGGV